MAELLMISPRNEGCSSVHSDHHSQPLQPSEQSVLLWAASAAKVKPWGCDTSTVVSEPAAWKSLVDVDVQSVLFGSDL